MILAFWGCSFIFNDIPCEDFDLMMYNIDGAEQSAGSFASGVSVVEQQIANRWKPLFYGTKIDKKLEFEIVFGVNQKRIDNDEYLDRYELEAIASWLTGHDQYLWLAVEQEDLEYVRYKCIISDLTLVEYGNVPYALRASVTCDGPYAYLCPQTFEYELDGHMQIPFYNESSHNGFYCPRIEFEPADGSGLRIANWSDQGREFLLSRTPSSVTQVLFDNENQIITCYADGKPTIAGDIYEDFNYKFFRLVKGMNSLAVEGAGTLRIVCEFPINVGG